MTPHYRDDPQPKRPNPTVPERGYGMEHLDFSLTVVLTSIVGLIVIVLMAKLLQ